MNNVDYSLMEMNENFFEFMVAEKYLEGSLEPDDIDLDSLGFVNPKNNIYLLMKAVNCSSFCFKSDKLSLSFWNRAIKKLNDERLIFLMFRRKIESAGRKRHSLHRSDLNIHQGPLYRPHPRTRHGLQD